MLFEEVSPGNGSKNRCLLSAVIPSQTAPAEGRGRLGRCFGRLALGRTAKNGPKPALEGIYISDTEALFHTTEYHSAAVTFWDN
jgi:hypothetical protein